MKYFEAVATIQSGYWMLSKQLKELESRKPIEVMIDQSTGYEKQFIKDTISIVEEIIDAKKVINEDYSNDETLLKQLKEHLKGNNE